MRSAELVGFESGSACVLILICMPQCNSNSAQDVGLDSITM